MGEHETIIEFVLSTYIIPAVTRGDNRVTIVVADVYRELCGSHGLIAIHAVLSSAELRKALDLKRSDDCSFDPFSPMALPKEYNFGLIPFRNRFSSEQLNVPSQSRSKTAGEV